MNEHEIQRAVEAIMALRPTPNIDNNTSMDRVEIKRRMDDLTYQRELTNIIDGNAPSKKVDFFSPGKLLSRNEPETPTFTINDAKAPKY
ncbi:TPA: hypothetical protein ACN37W_003759 [Vibrio parahaemolyticus]